MVFEKLKISDLPLGVTLVNYTGNWTEIEENEFITNGRRVIGESAFNDLYGQLVQRKTSFVFFTKTPEYPEYAVRITFPGE
jgi:hypothetical protein